MLEVRRRTSNRYQDNNRPSSVNVEVRRRTSNIYQVNNRPRSVSVGSEEKDVQQISGKQ